MMRRTITATPASLRAFLQVSVADALTAEAERGIAIELLEEARGLLSKQVSPDVAARGYLSIVDQYSKLMPNDALAVLREAVAAMNRPLEGPLPYDPLWEPIPVPALLLDIDEIGSRLVIANIASPKLRVAIGFGLLSSSIKQRKSSTTPRDKINTGKRENVN